MKHSDSCHKSKKKKIFVSLLRVVTLCLGVQIQFCNTNHNNSVQSMTTRLKCCQINVAANGIMSICLRCEISVSQCYKLSTILYFISRNIVSFISIKLKILSLILAFGYILWAFSSRAPGSL